MAASPTSMRDMVYLISDSGEAFNLQDYADKYTEARDAYVTVQAAISSCFKFVLTVPVGG